MPQKTTEKKEADLSQSGEALLDSSFVKDSKFNIKSMYMCQFRGCGFSGYYKQEEIDNHNKQEHEQDV